MPLVAGQQQAVKEVLGLNAYPDSSAFLSLTNAYQDLVTAPVSGLRRINQVVLSNEDGAIGTDFYIKLVKAGVDYVPVQIFLAPGERLILDFPWILDTTIKMQAKVNVACTSHAIASYVPYYGGGALNNFTGTAWSTIFTAPSNKDILGICIVNTDTVQHVVSLQVIDGGSVVKGIWNKTLTTGSSWFLDIKMMLANGWSIQVKQDTVAVTGSGFVSYCEF